MFQQCIIGKATVVANELMVYLVVQIFSRRHEHWPMRGLVRSRRSWEGFTFHS